MTIFPKSYCSFSLLICQDLFVATFVLVISIIQWCCYTAFSDWFEWFHSKINYFSYFIVSPDVIEQDFMSNWCFSLKADYIKHEIKVKHLSTLFLEFSLTLFSSPIIYIQHLCTLLLPGAVAVCVLLYNVFYALRCAGAKE